MVVFAGIRPSVNSGTGLALGPNQAGAYFTVCAFIFIINAEIIVNIKTKQAQLNAHLHSKIVILTHYRRWMGYTKLDRKNKLI